DNLESYYLAYWKLKFVSVGPLFQVEVPQWTGVVYGSDSKLLGTQIWPVKDDSRPTTETDLIGRGRRGKCSCKCSRFKVIMSLKIPSQNNSFCNNPSSYFQKRARKDMLSYYFNVYLIQLRSYQNQVTSRTVDSDDDEIEFESFGDGFENCWLVFVNRLKSFPFLLILP
ncbi:hypothetical protein MTR_0259s0060, partial [Medicago truncatula]